MFFLSGLQRKMGFAMVYIVVSISHQASKQDLKQEIKEKEKNVWKRLKIGMWITLFQIFLEGTSHLTKPVLRLVRNTSSVALVYKFADVFKTLLGTVV